MRKGQKLKETEIGMIPEDWETIYLGDVCSKIGSGITPRGAEKVYKDSGVVLVRSQNVHNNSFVEEGLVYIDEATAQQMENVALEKDDVLLNITGDSVARCCTVPERILPGRVNQHVSILRTNREQLNPFFLRYYLTSPRMQAFMLSLAQSGGTRNALTKGMIEKFPIPKPPLSEQHQIAKILSDLDSKIELNEQMNETLEAIGRAIFTHWFIDFEFPNEEGRPYKSSGGEMVYSEELGKEIPKGWKVGEFEEFIDLDKGLSYKGEFLSDEGIPLINLGTIAPGAGFIREGLKHYVGEYKERQLVRAGDIVVANTDITQKREVLGSPAIVPPYLGSETALFTHHIFAVRNGSQLPKSFIYHLLQTTLYRDRVRGFATGTTVLALPRDAILDLTFAVPDGKLLDKFDVLYSLLFQKTNASTMQSMCLAQIREFMLPKLMSGKIRVPVEVR